MKERVKDPVKENDRGVFRARGSVLEGLGEAHLWFGFPGLEFTVSRDLESKF